MDKVLSTEEVDAILKVAQETDTDLTELIGSQSRHDVRPEYNYALNSITELTRVDCEDVVSAFLKKRLTFNTKTSKYSHFSDCIKGKDDNFVYCLFHILPHDYHGLLIFDLPFLHHSLNLLYGGQINASEEIISHAGKVGLLVAEKIAALFLEGFAQACVEYVKIECEVVKTVPSPNLITKLNTHNHCFLQEFGVLFDELETTIHFMVEEAFLLEALPAKLQEIKSLDQHSWRNEIQGSLVDSIVTLNVTLPEINMKIGQFVSLKEGDVIPISDPTDVFVSMNNVKLFRARAGQTTSMRVAKIESEF